MCVDCLPEGETLALAKRVPCHIFRHSSAAQLLESGCDIRTDQERLGHEDVKTPPVLTGSPDPARDMTEGLQQFVHARIVCWGQARRPYHNAVNPLSINMWR